MKYESYFDVFTFPFWGGGKIWADKFFEEGLASVLAEDISEYFSEWGEVPTNVDINEYVWFSDLLHWKLEEYK